MRVCESLLGTKLIKIARDDTYVYKVTHVLFVFLFWLLKRFLTKTGPKLLMPTV